MAGGRGEPLAGMTCSCVGQQRESPLGLCPHGERAVSSSRSRPAPGHCEGERAERTRGGCAGTKAQSLPEPVQFRKSLAGKRAGVSRGRPRENRAAPTGPGPEAQASVFPGCGEPAGSIAAAQPSPRQAPAASRVPTGRAGSTAHPRGLPGRRRPGLPEAAQLLPPPHLILSL